FMVDMDIPADNVPAEQAPAVAPPTRTDDQILPLSKWVPIGKSNCVLDFWDTMCFNSSTGLYSCQLDEQWFNLHKNILRDALNITPANDNNPFVAPPSSDTVIEAILSMINMCLTGKTTRYDRPRHPVLQILWGIIHRSNIDYAERIWEEFVQSIQTFLTNRKNLATAARGKKDSSYAYSKFVGKDGREIFGMPIPDTLLTDEIKGAPYYEDYQEHVVEYQQILDAERSKAEEGRATESSKTTKVTKPKAAKVIKPANDPAPKKRKMVKETSDDPLPAKSLKAGLVGKMRKAKSPRRLIDDYEDQVGPNPSVQDEGQARPNPGIAIESQLQSSHVVHAGPNLEHMDLGTSDASTQQKPEQMDEEFTTTTCPNVQGNLKLLTEDQVILEELASSTGTLSSLQNLDKDLSFTDQFFMEKPQEEEPWKTNVEAEVQSMVSVLIHQDTSSVPLMTTPVIDLTKSQSDSPLPTSTATTSTITTTTILPPPQPQQSTADPILVKRIGELEQHMADLIQNNLALEERLDKQGSRLYNLENLNIPHKVSQAVDEIVIDAVNWAMQAPLRAHFRDLPTVDMKEILQQRMFEDNSYQAHDIHNDLYKALQKSLELDYTNQRLADQEEARKKRQKRRDIPRTPHGSPPS
ncbi:hypothetical protein Tco_1006559, partial [Tanacetum coccineum]